MKLWCYIPIELWCYIPIEVWCYIPIELWCYIPIELWCYIPIEMGAEFYMHFGVIDPSQWATKPQYHGYTQWNTNFPKNLVVILKFYTLECSHKTSLILKTHTF